MEKEFKQILRNSFVPRIIVMMPLMVMLVFPWAANQEIRNMRLVVVDNDHSTYSQSLVRRVSSSGYFNLAANSVSNQSALEHIEIGRADIVLEIEPGFERNLIREGQSEVMISANAVNGMKAGLGASYLSSIIRDFAADTRAQIAWTNSEPASASSVPQISITPSYRFNPRLDYKVFMVPALMVMVLTLICGFLPALNIVGEKEAGTIEQMNVTPVSKLKFILAKLIPYWIIGFVIITVCFAVAALVYGLVPNGSLLTIYIFASIYILMVSGLGLVISNYSNTMQQAMFVIFFFVMLLILMSGLFTPVASMPEWARAITVVNPLKYFMHVMRMVYLKGSSIFDLGTQMAALSIMALFFNGWAVLSYRKSK